MGFRVSLDDFGTGYSSLSYLASMSVDKIKLDRSFLNRDYANDSAIIHSVITMAHRIGLSVVAEGIETRAQSERLIELDCDEQQGFYFSKAIPGNAVPGYLDSMQTEPALSHAGIDQT